MSLETEHAEILVRQLSSKDQKSLVALDRKITGIDRSSYFSLKLSSTLKDTGIQISLAAEVDGSLVGFVLARVYYGEFGRVEPSAVLDTIGVQPELQGRGVAHAMVKQLCTNLRGLGIKRLQTEVDWEDQALLTFFHHQGFAPAPRFCLDLDLDPE